MQKQCCHLHGHNVHSKPSPGYCDIYIRENFEMTSSEFPDRLPLVVRPRHWLLFNLSLCVIGRPGETTVCGVVHFTQNISFIIRSYCVLLSQNILFPRIFLVFSRIFFENLLLNRCHSHSAKSSYSSVSPVPC